MVSHGLSGGGAVLAFNVCMALRNCPADLSRQLAECVALKPSFEEEHRVPSMCRPFQSVSRCFISLLRHPSFQHPGGFGTDGQDK